MSFISEYFTPFLNQYHRLIDGKYIAHQLQFKGSAGEVGGDYINKINRANKRAIQSKYEEVLGRVKEPTLAGFVEDNFPRLLLNPFDRLIAAFQAYPTLKARFTQPGTFSHTFTEIMNEGVLLGAFKGVVFNFAQLALVLYPSVYFANKSQSKYTTFISTYTLLDALFYPIDSLKNILYADTLAKYNIKTVAQTQPFLNLYQGFFLKLAYNVPVLSGIYCTSQTGLEYHALGAWALAALLYPINTEKVRRQVSGTSISTVTSKTAAIAHSGYRGVVPYILLNAVIGYSLRPLYSQSKLSEIEGQVKKELKNLGYN